MTRNYSVVIPMYNASSTIKQALYSVITQSKFDLINEIIIVDDGSTDDSIKNVNEFIIANKLSIVKVIKKINEGAASARNVGINASENDFIALLDSDDVWLPNKIKKQDEVFERNPNIRAIGSNRKGEIIYFGKKIFSNLYKLSPIQYCLKNWPCTPSFIFDKRIFKNSMYFDESMSHAEEGIFFLDIAFLNGLYYMTDVLVECGHGKKFFGQTGLSGNIKKMHKGQLKMLRMAKDKKYINCFQYFFLIVYEHLKYLRRIILTKN